MGTQRDAEPPNSAAYPTCWSVADLHGVAPVATVGVPSQISNAIARTDVVDRAAAWNEAI
ncbi:hypothetical protein KCP91_15620 [Microvirga sp. SRT01]|uniref:Uncharacterized protein n=1 Tax=Sphingomonas longa TaxID=2778730 RepID=A0ABS2DA36_9SPHN|nr:MULTISPECIES: hypothetical protein [Alphaproteobacteria]MBM6577812.1 hypothetical protein [Sphingomonas sp. BT552]MBR7710854.1 hypothetical protein [Microvirga sp. SRT01]